MTLRRIRRNRLGGRALGAILGASAALGAMCAVAAADAPAGAARSSPVVAHVVFVSDRDGDADVYAARPDARRPRTLTRNSAEDQEVMLAPSGRWLALARARSMHGDPRAMLVRTDGSGERQLGNASAAAFSPDGRWLAVTRRNWETETSTVELVPLGPGRVRKLGRGAPWVFSADGRRLAFVEDSGAVQNDFGAGVIDVATGRRTRIRAVPPFVQPTWSPNLTGVAFVQEHEAAGSDDEELVAVTVRPRQRRVLARGDLGSFTWLGERRLAFERYLGVDNREIVVVGADGRGRRVIARGDVESAEWSPTGDRVALSVRDGRAVVVASLGTRTRHTIDLPNRLESITWSPSGRRLAAGLCTPAGRRELVVVDARRGTTGARARVGGDQALWSPDERTIAVDAAGIVFVSAATGRFRRLTRGGNNRIVGWARSRLPANAPRAARPPTPEERRPTGFASRSGVLEIASDGPWVGAIISDGRIDCEHVVAWNARSRSLVRFGPPARCRDTFSFRRLALDGTTVTWAKSFCGNYCYVAGCAADVRRAGAGGCGEESEGNAPRRPLPTSETRDGVAFSVVNGTIRLHRVADGRLRTIRPPGRLVDAELETTGLVYAYTTRAGRFHGHVAFLRFDAFFR
jgi:Tol biopolymer transport system component